MDTAEAGPSTSKLENEQPEAGPSSGMSMSEKKQLLASLPKKKKSLRMKERKIRDNYRLRKLVMPKHALLAINELKGVNISTFNYTMTPHAGQAGFLAEATINGIGYKGRGRSKNLAKTDVCDQALRDIMLKKMTATAKKIEDNAEVTPDEEVPIVTLVSYAIHKLFADWEAEGFCLKCAGSKGKEDPDKCTCVEGSTGLQAALAQITAPIDPSECENLDVTDVDGADVDVTDVD